MRCQLNASLKYQSICFGRHDKKWNFFGIEIYHSDEDNFETEQEYQKIFKGNLYSILEVKNIV